MAALMRLMRPFNLSGRTVTNFPKFKERQIPSHIEACVCVPLKYQSTISANKEQSTIHPQEQSTILSQRDEKSKQVQFDVQRLLEYNKSVPIHLYKTLYKSLMGKENGLDEKNASLLLHICTLGPFDLSSKGRVELANDVWSQIDRRGLPITTKLYNLRLKTYLKNGVEFDTLTEMNRMKDLKINPDKVTCELLIDGFCEKGDMTGANLVLQTMKDLNYGVGVNTFNSFITGYLHSGNLKDAQGVFDLIKTRKDLQPSADTFFRFARYFAGKGDLESVHQYIAEAEQADIALQKQLFLIHHAFLCNGHKSQAQEFLKVIKDQGFLNTFVFEACCQLVADGHAKEGLELYDIQLNTEDISKVDEACFLLRAMINNNYSAEALLEMADNILESRPQTTPHQFALLYAYKFSNSSSVGADLLKLLQTKGHAMKMPYFLPAISLFKKKKNIEGIYDMISVMMNSRNHSGMADMTESLIHFVYPTLVDLKQSRIDILNNTEEKNQSLWNSLFFYEDLDRHGIEIALQNANGKELDPHIIKSPDFKLMFSKDSPKNGMVLLDATSKICRNKDRVQTVLREEILRKLMVQKDLSMLDKCLNHMIEQKMTVQKQFLYIQYVSRLPAEMQKKLQSICINTYQNQGSILSMDEMRNQSKEKLEEFKSKNPKRGLPSLLLLEKALEAKNDEEIKKNLEDLKDVDFEIRNVYFLTQLLNYLIDAKDIENALHYSNQYTKSGGKRVDFPLDIALLQIEAGNFDEAVQLLADADKNNEKNTLKVRRVSGKMFSHAKDLTQLDALKDALLKDGQIKDKELLYILGDYLNFAMKFVNDEELMQILVKIHEKYRIFPSMHKILVRLIKNKNVAQLNVAMKVGDSVVGNRVFHHKLAIGFLSADMPSKALKVLMTPGLRIIEPILYNFSKDCIKFNDISALESLVDITKELPLNRTDMLSQLIAGHVRNNDIEKATNVLHRFDEECLKPTESSISLLVQYHKNGNQEIPQILQSYIKESPSSEVPQSPSSEATPSSNTKVTES